MTSSEIRQRFLNFFANRGHAILPSSSLIPKNDPSVLFNTAGMQPLVPYLLGEKHPQGKRLVSCQKCVRTGDIEEIGDNTHNTFFEMLGNWSLGDYFKEEAIKWSFELLTSKEEGFGLDPNRLYITLFEGNKDAPRDQESFEIWKNYVPEHRIYFLGWNGKKEPNWWDAGENGPCGPDTEIFYDITADGIGDMTKEEYLQADKRQTIVEIWNNVFMEYLKEDGLVVRKLQNKNVDTGSGFERLVMTLQGKSNIFETDLFNDVLLLIKEQSHTYNEQSARVIADHLRASLFLAADGVLPSNKDQGYILRRLIRRATVRLLQLEISEEITLTILKIFIEKFKIIYPEVTNEKNIDTVYNEVIKFKKTIEQGMKEFDKNHDPFILATTYGFPIELTEELAKEKGIVIDREKFNRQMKTHQGTSRKGAEQKFKGGLANTSDMTVKLHTAHHLLLAALQKILGSEVHQRGSNITEERLRIDFNFDRKLTDEEKQAIEQQVNEWILTNYIVCRREMSRAEAEGLGAEMEFGTKYPDTVNVYFIEDENGNQISKEFCGGPHVEQTVGLGIFKIQKEEAIAAGIRRIKATLS